MPKKLSKSALKKRSISQKAELVRLNEAIEVREKARLEHRRKRIRRRFRMDPPKPYRSWYEVYTAIQLLEESVFFEYEKEYLLYLEPAQVRKYRPDFKIGRFIIETKGRWTPADRKKMGLVIEQNPELDIRMLFQRDNTITKKSKIRYSDWCEKRGITYAIGKVPKEWIEE